MPDGTVNRTPVQYDNGNLMHWVVMHDGEVVLKRNARNETQYRYFRRAPGVYTIYLALFIDGSYRPISNVVSYKL